MHIRHYQAREAPKLWELFYNTIHFCNNKDYSQAQVNAWAPKQVDMADWINKSKKRKPFVCVQVQQIIGYSDLQANGYIDHFFCHHEYQGKGVGRALMQHIASLAKQQDIGVLKAEVSLTAKGFFEHMGFVVLNKQQVSIRGQWLTNYKMQKILKD